MSKKAEKEKNEDVGLSAGGLTIPPYCRPAGKELPRTAASRRSNKPLAEAAKPLLKPIDIKREARVPYKTVMGWLQVGHAKAGVLPSIDFAETGQRHSYRIRAEDWEAFQRRLSSAIEPPPTPVSNQEPRRRKRSSPFQY